MNYQLSIYTFSEREARSLELFVESDAEITQRGVGGQASVKAFQSMMSLSIEATQMLMVPTDGLHYLTNASQRRPVLGQWWELLHLGALMPTAPKVCCQRWRQA